MMSSIIVADPGAAFCVIEQNGVPSSESIERWRKWAIHQLNKDALHDRDRDPQREAFVNRLFDYAQLGRDKHIDVRRCARKELASMLKSIARQVDVKGKGRNISPEKHDA